MLKIKIDGIEEIERKIAEQENQFQKIQEELKFQEEQEKEQRRLEEFMRVNEIDEIERMPCGGYMVHYKDRTHRYFKDIIIDTSPSDIWRNSLKWEWHKWNAETKPTATAIIPPPTIWN